MKTKFKVMSLILILPFVLFGQKNNYYYYKGQKIPLEIDRKYVNIVYDSTFQFSNIENLNIISSSLNVLSCNPGEVELKITKIEFITSPENIEFIEKINKLKNTPGIISVCLYYKKSESTSIGTSNVLYVKLKNSEDVSLLNENAALKNYTISHQNKFMPLWYGLSLKKETLETSIELANYLIETGLFEDIDPAFMFDFKPSGIAVDPPCSNDEYFDDLWGINNTTNPNIDMNACQAWTITEGAGVNVAIIDQGIQKDHIDLSTNVHPNSFDTCFGQGSSPSQSYFFHGTWVAGPIGAIKNNNEGVVGIAPQSKLIDISNKLLINSHISEQLANGMNWAWQNGADIINNSWGDQGGNPDSANLHSTLLENSIINALTFGRGGLGSIVVFSAGNHAPTLDYPSNFIDEIICVGAMNNSGNRRLDSAFGNNLDVMAPGDNILTTANDNFYDYVSQTSIATPYVSGIAALILSVNPCLSNKQVNTIIEKTAQKVSTNTYSYSTNPERPNGTWNNEMGYGLVDAYAAVQLAQAMNSASLDFMVRDAYDDFGIEPNNNSPIIWNSPDIWVRNQNDGIEEHQKSSL